MVKFMDFYGKVDPLFRFSQRHIAHLSSLKQYGKFHTEDLLNGKRIKRDLTVVDAATTLEIRL